MGRSNKKKRKNSKSNQQGQNKPAEGNVSQGEGTQDISDGNGACALPQTKDGSSTSAETPQDQPNTQTGQGVEVDIPEEDRESQENGEKFYPCGGNSEGDFVIVEGMSPKLLTDAQDAIGVIKKLVSVCQEIHGDGGKVSMNDALAVAEKVKQELDAKKAELLEANRLLEECKRDRDEKVTLLERQKENGQKWADERIRKMEDDAKNKGVRIKELENLIQEMKNQGQKANIESRKQVAEVSKELENRKRKLDEGQQREQNLKATIQRLEDNQGRYVKDKKEMEECISHLKKENDMLSSSLSKMMNDKMNEDESQVENISIKARPLKLVEEFELFCTGEWLTAKTTLDECTDVCFLMGEQRKCQILLDILMEAGNVSAKRAEDHMIRMKRLLDNPLEMYDGDQSVSAEVLADGSSVDMEEPCHNKPSVCSLKSTKIPSELESEINKYLKIHSEEIDSEVMAKAILRRMLQTIPDAEMTPQTKASQELLDYTKSACVLTWKMAIQRPPMFFTRDNGKGETYNPDQYDLQFGTMDPNIPGVKIVQTVFPSLWHHQKLMKKGRVLLGHVK